MEIFNHYYFHLCVHVFHLVNPKHFVWYSTFAFWENLSERMWTQYSARGGAQDL